MLSQNTPAAFSKVGSYENTGVCACMCVHTCVLVCVCVL